jgi:hypothetical protein
MARFIVSFIDINNGLLKNVYILKMTACLFSQNIKYSPHPKSDQFFLWNPTIRKPINPPPLRFVELACGGRAVVGFFCILKSYLPVLVIFRHLYLVIAPKKTGKAVTCKEISLL